MVFITIVTGAYKPTYILGDSHCTIHIIALLFRHFPFGFADEFFIFPNGKSITWRLDEGIHFCFFGALKQIQMFNGIGSFSPELSGKKQIFVETCSLAGKELNISAKQSGR